MSFFSVLTVTVLLMVVAAVVLLLLTLSDPKRARAIRRSGSGGAYRNATVSLSPSLRRLFGWGLLAPLVWVTVNGWWSALAILSGAFLVVGWLWVMLLAPKPDAQSEHEIS